MQLQRILLYPIKALDAVAVSEAKFTPRGALEHDRAYAIFDKAGLVMNGKRTARVHEVRSAFSADFREVSLWAESESELQAVRFVLAEPERINRWLSDFFELAVELKHDPQSGFPDDTIASGPTIVSKSSLREVHRWFPQLTLESVRRRFRTNLELSGEEEVPFWEDRLYGQPGELKPFHIGEVQFRAHNPCQRCVVPTRDPASGEPTESFQKTFMALRRETLPPWAAADQFNHFYRFAVNTSVPTSESGKVLRVGDEVALDGR